MSSFLSFTRKQPVSKHQGVPSTQAEPMTPSLPASAKDRLKLLLNQVDDTTLSNMLQTELQLMMNDQQRLVTMLEQRSELLEVENEELKVVIGENQKRYEKAVREMQFFKKKYDRLAESMEMPHHLQQYSTPSNSPQPSNNNNSVPCSVAESSTQQHSVYSYHTEKLNWPTSPTYSEHINPLTRRRNNSNATGSIFSGFSSSTESTSYSHLQRYDENGRKPATYQFSRNPSMVSSYSTPSTVPSMASCSSSVSGRSGVSLSESMIQQRRTDPLSFGGSDAFWETLSKNGEDATVEKIISNFLRRGGSPNTAKQSPSTQTVKYGYGMIHALVANKVPGALDLLLQQGANPNVVSIGQVNEEKVSPCYLAARVGWLIGLQKLVQAGGDLMSARGCGDKKKTALHTAAEGGHAAVVEYIVNITQGVSIMETDALGANALHYACVSGHVDLVSYFIRVCQIPIDEKNCKGEIPLHWAVRSGKLEVATLLIERYGCDVNAYVTKKVGTPYDLAKSAGHKRLVEYLKSNGGTTAKKMDKRREEELSDQVPKHLESILTKNGFLMDGF